MLRSSRLPPAAALAGRRAGMPHALLASMPHTTNRSLGPLVIALTVTVIVSIFTVLASVNVGPHYVSASVRGESTHVNATCIALVPNWEVCQGGYGPITRDAYRFVR